MNSTDRKFRRQRHWVELKELGYQGGSLAKINSVERRAHRIAEDWCNGTITDHEQEKRLQGIVSSLRELFGGDLPDNFYINLDPRGYALKINQEGQGKPITYQDWGGYGILAPEDL